jgi:hypothetical protein
MKNYNGILILEPEDTYQQPISATESRLSIRGGPKPLYEAVMAIAKKSDGWLFCLKDRERDPNSYSQAELQEIVNRYENPVDERIILLNC